MTSELTREQIEMLVGATVLEFGATWCGICQATSPLFQQVLADHPEVRHLQVEDGKGKRLGRTFGVKLWPTFVFLQDGSEVARLVRPRSVAQLREAFRAITAPASEHVAR